MRFLRWLPLVALIVIGAAVFSVYRTQRNQQRSQRRPLPPAVAKDTKTTATDWEWGQSANGQPAVKLFAKNFQQSANSDNSVLEHIELRIYQKDGLHYDRVLSPWANFNSTENKLFSPVESQITLDVPVEGTPPHQLTSITTSGVNFDSKTGQANTEKNVAFTFENGDGKCVGASYDPQTHVLVLNQEVVVNLRGKDPGSIPMKVEAGQLTYSETTGLIQLSPWSRLTRDQTVINAAQSTVQLKDGMLETVDAVEARGTDKRPNRNLEYSASAIHVHYNDSGEMDLLTGTGSAKLIAHGEGSDTTMTGDRVDLWFADENGESVLSSARATGNGALESRPVADPKGDTADTKLLKAELFDLHMKAGGKDLDRVETQTPGTLEFQPNQAARHRRLLHAEHMNIVYAARNEVESFHGTKASTDTWPSQQEIRARKPAGQIAHTTSETLDARFDEKGQLKEMKQAGEFRYSEGERKAQSSVATLENDRNRMDLDTGARISDSTGSTMADHIILQQDTGDFDARGHVATTRLPEQKASGESQPASAMLDENEPLRGTADRVTTGQRNQLVHYDGNAVLWQSGSRIQASRIDIDRAKKTLIADGAVVTEFQDKDNSNKSADAGKPAARSSSPIFTIVKASHMVYTDQDRLATYSGNVSFWRPTLTVKSTALKAWMNEQHSSDEGNDSRLNHAFGDGKVEISQLIEGRQRIGTSEHAEYYTDEGKIILTGGKPQLKDTLRGNTIGDKLTYYTDDERLLVDGAPRQEVQSHLHRKKS